MMNEVMKENFTGKTKGILYSQAMGAFDILVDVTDLWLR